MLEYLIYMILFQLVFLLVFELLLKKETFFTYNRWYLLLTPVISLLLPFIKVQGLQQVMPMETIVALPQVILGEAGGIGKMDGHIIKDSGTNIWLLIYFAGGLVSLLWLLKKSVVLKQLFQNKVVSKESYVNIIEVPNSHEACTFFKTIFLGDQLSRGERKHIISHEMVHVQEKHSWDLLFFELIKILFWFDPLLYIYQSRISALHEFIADAGAVKTVEKRNYYQQLLNTAFQTENISFINQFFNHSLIKKRIVMLQKTRSTAIAKLRFLVLLPVLFFMLTLVSFTPEIGNKNLGTIQETTLKIDVQDVQDQTAAEKEEVQAALEDLKDGKPYTKVIVTDGTSRIIYEATSESGIAIITKTEELVSSNNVTDIPFELIEEAPVFPGCKDLETEEEKRECLVMGITKHVNTNFNLNLAKNLPLTGLQKIFVQFKIDETGKVTAVKARAPMPELEQEAIRVVEALPQMTSPGRSRGKKVSVLYALPIQIMINQNTGEKTTSEE